MVEMRATTSAPATAEETIKHVIHVHVVELLPAALLAFALLVLANTLFALHVVDAALVCVGQSLVCVGDLLELLLCTLGVVLVLVWVVLDGKLLESFLNLILSGILLDAEQLVVVIAFFFFGLLPLLLLLSLVVLLMVMLLLSAVLGSSQNRWALATVPLRKQQDDHKGYQKFELSHRE